MLYTFVTWTDAIDHIEHSKVNPIIGLALDEPTATKMHNIFGTMPKSSSTCRTKEGPYLAVRSCVPLTKAQLATVRAVMYGVHAVSR
jgi:hypothetical protein